MIEKGLRLLGKINDGVAKALAWVAALFLVTWVFIMMAGLLGRAFFQISWMFVEEFTAYITLVVGCWGFHYALNKNTHIRLTFLLDRCPPRFRWILETLFTTTAIFLYSVMTLKALGWFIRALKTGAASPQTNLPMWIPYVVPLAGFGGLLLGLLFHLSQIRIRVLGESKNDKKASL